ncbi:MAG: rhodanese-like domain-containing protein [Deltaproteobacteria bacterium]|nr:rhodanese-like domain-containing protein [Deltaproteobacteria bacterium]
MSRKEVLVFLARLFVVAVLFLPACSRRDPNVLEPTAALELIASRRGHPDFVLVDVRTLGEFRAGHIEGARLIDFHGADFLQKMAELDRESTVFLYCRSGNRSAKARRELREMGFVTTYDLAGGVIAWSETGLPLVRAAP